MIRTNRTIITLALTVAVVALASSGALAAKGAGKGHGGNTTSSDLIKIVYLDSTDGQAHWGQQVTFTVTTSATTRPYVSLVCMQGSDRVYGSTAGMFDSYTWSRNFTLQSTTWTGGDADCTATAYYFTGNGAERTLGSLPFTAFA